MNKLLFPVLSLLAAGIFILGGLNLRLYNELSSLKSQINRPFLSSPPPTAKINYDVPESGQSGEISQTQEYQAPDRFDELKSYIDSSLATIAATKKTTVSGPESTSTPKTQTTYISLGSTFSSTSTDWVEVPDSGVYVNLADDYGAMAKVTWEASLKVANGNGQAYARLWDDTNKIAVSSSELSTTNNSEFKQVFSSVLPFWRGKNLYKVQIKSLNSFVVTYSGGRVKITY